VVEIATIKTPSLGDRSYLVTDGRSRWSWDIDRVLALTADRGITVTHVFETHIHNGFGSFCAASLPGSDGSTIAEEQHVNPALTLDEDSYVADLLAGLDDYPAYYARMAPANAAGPQPPDLTPLAEPGADEIRRRIGAGEWVVDLRDRVAFAAGDVPGSFSFGYGDSLVPNLGWLLAADADR
jgi:hydroxyacylglutathione hydrolase